MKPLAYSLYCPNDCDRPKAVEVIDEAERRRRAPTEPIDWMSEFVLNTDEDQADPVGNFIDVSQWVNDIFGDDSGDV